MDVYLGIDVGSVITKYAIITGVGGGSSPITIFVSRASQPL
jgi:hypothetical protein